MGRWFLVVLALALADPPARGHGGQIDTPVDVTPGDDSPTNGPTAPPTNPGGKDSPGPGAVITSAGSARPGRTADGRAVRGGSGRVAAATVGADPGVPQALDTWEPWWDANSDRFLDLKRREPRVSSVSGSPGQLTSRGRKSGALASRRPSQDQVDDEVVPLLLELLATSREKDVLDSSLLALARVVRGDEPRAARVIEATLPFLEHAELSVQSTACLALGVLGSPAAVPTLQHLLADDSRGRSLTGGGAVHWLVRSFAALGLGLIGERKGLASLIEAVERLPDSDADLKTCAVVGLGLLPAGHPHAGHARVFLEGELLAHDPDPAVAAFVPVSLGRLGQREALPALHAAFLEPRQHALVRQSCVIAMGRLALPADAAVTAALLDCVAQDRDELTRRFALVALGQIGAADDGEAAGVVAFRAALRELLARELKGQGQQRGQRSWAALAAANWLRPGRLLEPDLVERIEIAYREESDPAFKSAFALSLGLLDARGAAAAIQTDFHEIKDQAFRGTAAVALGFLQQAEVAEPLLVLCGNKATDPELRLQAAAALGLLGDAQAVPTLVQALQDAQTLGVSSAVAKALGLIGDESAVAPLVLLARDEGAPALARAFACVALGRLCEKTPLPWNAAIRSDSNYLPKVPALQEILDIL